MSIMKTVAMTAVVMALAEPLMAAVMAVVTTKRISLPPISNSVMSESWGFLFYNKMIKTIIRYNKILDEITKAHSLTISKYADRAKQPTDMVVVTDKIHDYQKAWSEIDQKIFAAIEQMSGKPFPCSIVNVNLVWVVNRTEAFSMIIPVSLSADKFIVCLTHELMHLSGANFTDDFKEKYKELVSETRTHIMIHAMMEYLYRDVLNRPDYVDMSKSQSLKHSNVNYIDAWKIVEEVGYKNILKRYLD